MKLFPECDKACIDASRMFYGGKGLHSCQFDNRVNPFALFDTYLKQLELKSPSNFARARTNFLNDIGIAISETEIGVKFFDEFILENEEILVSTLIYMRNPTESGHPFRRKAATHSDGRRPPIPTEGGHRFRGKAATC
jgi:hypothetical protein